MYFLYIIVIILSFFAKNNKNIIDKIQIFRVVLKEIKNHNKRAKNETNFYENGFNFDRIWGSLV